MISSVTKTSGRMSRKSFCAIGDRRQRAQAAGEHGVAQERLAEIVGGVAEGDHVGAQFAADLVDGAAAEAAAQVAAVVGLVVEQAERGPSR